MHYQGELYLIAQSDPILRDMSINSAIHRSYFPAKTCTTNGRYTNVITFIILNCFHSKTFCFKCSFVSMETMKKIDLFMCRICGDLTMIPVVPSLY